MDVKVSKPEPLINLLPFNDPIFRDDDVPIYVFKYISFPNYLIIYSNFYDDTIMLRFSCDSILVVPVGPNVCEVLCEIYASERENKTFSHEWNNFLPHQYLSWDKVNDVTTAYQEGNYFSSNTSWVHNRSSLVSNSLFEMPVVGEGYFGIQCNKRGRQLSNGLNKATRGMKEGK
jgi:hypothetical protein